MAGPALSSYGVATKNLRRWKPETPIVEDGVRNTIWTSI
jgi:hypothetical protein